MRIAVFCVVLATSPVHASSIDKNANLEMAAKINVAENMCGINFNRGRGYGYAVTHHVMLAASELGLSVVATAELADRRSRQIVVSIKQKKRVKEFCRNAKAGRL